jgi:hypothetical protein
MWVPSDVRHVPASPPLRRPAAAEGTPKENRLMTTIVDKVKLVVVHRASPDRETELGTYPSKDAAMPAYQEAVAKNDTLRAAIEPVDAKATPENSASYQRSSDAPKAL